MSKKGHKPTSFSRTEKTGQLLQEALAKLIQLEVRDPRLPKLITLSRVKVSPDLSHATIYFTALSATSDESDNFRKETAHILNHAASYLRAQLPQAIQLRIVPRLHFIYDESLEKATHLSNLIAQLPEKLEDDDTQEND